MDDAAIDPAILHAWLAARSVARGLPAPVADHGGFRVDTLSDGEIRRWVFSRIDPGLMALARTIRLPGYLLKACVSTDQLRGALPARWRVHAPAYFMGSGGDFVGRPLAKGYSIETETRDSVGAVRIRAATGEIAASGFMAETDEAFIYDRIVTAPDHRRKGLATAIMGALRQMKRRRDAPELLVATEDGRPLYESLGWRVLSPYSTASIDKE